MAHHSSDKSLAALFGSTSDLVRKAGDALKFEDFLKPVDEQEIAKNKQLLNVLGPTGDYPSGRLVPHDEGGLMFGLTVFNGRVIFDFGKPIRSIGFTREGALELAELIKQRAMQCPEILFPKA